MVERIGFFPPNYTLKCCMNHKAKLVLHWYKLLVDLWPFFKPGGENGVSSVCSHSVSFGLTFCFTTKMFHQCMFQMHISFLSKTLVRRRNNRFCRVTGLYIFHLAVMGIYCTACILFFLPVFSWRIWMKKSWRTAVCVYIT